MECTHFPRYGYPPQTIFSQCPTSFICCICPYLFSFGLFMHNAGWDFSNSQQNPQVPIFSYKRKFDLLCLFNYSVIDCGTPPKVKNAVRSMDERGTGYTATVTYACKRGFHRDPNAGKLDRKCGLNSQWDGEAPVCLGKSTTYT